MGLGLGTVHRAYQGAVDASQPSQNLSKTILPAKLPGESASRRVNVLSDGLFVAGFQVIMSGRFWVFTEAIFGDAKKPAPEDMPPEADQTIAGHGHNGDDTYRSIK
jgi:hypothetical protein